MCNQFYVDDLMFFVDTIEEGKMFRDQIRLMLKAAGMPLVKITANHPNLLKELPSLCVEANSGSNLIKALGIAYDYRTVEFSYQLKAPDVMEKLTKTNVLSTIAGIYDPIG